MTRAFCEMTSNRLDEPRPERVLERVSSRGRSSLQHATAFELWRRLPRYPEQMLTNLLEDDLPAHDTTDDDT
jgi:hypothetical protein